ncbi:MAG: carboxypeptidase-like regulatory domain-containing protein [Anaeromyxobacteraceae bacterium]
MLRRSMVLFASLVLGACGSLDHTNPFDPSTPATQQARATLAGAVSLEAPGAVAPSLTGVHVSVPGTSFAADTDATGHYAIADVPPGTYSVQAVAAGYDTVAVTGITVTLDDGTRTVGVPDLALKVSRGSVSGTITSKSFGALGAAPLAGASVSVEGLPGAALTDEAGGFLLSGVPAGAKTINVARSGFLAPTGVQVQVSGNALSDAGAVALDWDPGGVKGTLLVQGAATQLGVTVRVKGFTLVGSPFEVTGASAADGSWGIQGLVPAGTYNVTFELANYATVATTATVAPHTTTDLPAVTLVRDTGDLTGLATLEGSGDSSGVLVTVTQAATTTVAGAALTDTSGVWQVGSLPVGTYDLAFTKTGYTAQHAQAIVLSHKTVSAPSQVLSAIPGVLRGRCLAEGLAAPGLSGTTVRVIGTTLSTLTLGDGSWVIPGVGSGAQVVRLERAGWDAQEVQVVSSPGGDLTLFDVTLAASRGAITGTVSLSAGALTGFSPGSDLSGVVVSLTGTDEPVAAAVTDASGAYRFPQVRVSALGAPFTVTARKPNYGSSSTSVLAVANADVDVATTLVLPVNAGSASGTVVLWDNVSGGGNNATSANVAVQASGAAFNGTSFTASTTTASSGAWSAAVPPGTYTVTATSTNRTCAAIGQIVVAEGEAKAVPGQFRCTDAVAPNSPVLGAPAVPGGAQPGYTNLTSISVPIATQATDATSPGSNLRGYQTFVGPLPTWADTSSGITAGQPANLTFSLSSGEGTYTLWARAVDWAGNAGTAASATVVLDSSLPPAPTIATARNAVNDTSAAVTLSGAEASPNFLQYEACTGTAGGASCGATPSCVSPATPTATPAGFAASLTQNARNCVWARSRDKAGNASAFAVTELVSDLLPPTGPTVAPVYDAADVTVHANYVDFFVTAPATDQPLNAGNWQDISWVEVDTGAGFAPLCPNPACRPKSLTTGRVVYNPCSCGCTDARLLCNGTTFAGVRVPLRGASTTRFAVRSVDAAGNVGSGAQQEVANGDVLDVLLTGPAVDRTARVGSRLMTWKTGSSAFGAFTAHLTVLGANGRYDATDRTCSLATTGSATTSSFSAENVAAEPASPAGVVHADVNGTVVLLRRPGPDGIFCSGDEPAPVTVRAAQGSYTMHAVSGTIIPGTRCERLAWIEQEFGANFRGRVMVADMQPGVDGVCGTSDDTVGAPAQVVANDPGYVAYVKVAGNVLLYRLQSFNNGPTSGNWTIVSAGAAGFGGATTTISNPLTIGPSGNWIDVNRDGSLLAIVDTGGTIHVWRPGPNGLFEGPGTGDDPAEVTRSSGLSPSQLSIDAGHVALIGSSGPTSYIGHWYAGADGAFQAQNAPDGDDSYALLLPTTANRRSPSIHDGRVYFTVTSGSEDDLHAADLTTLRWETLTGSTNAQLRSNRAGALVFSGRTGLTARMPDGLETTCPSCGSFRGLDADGPIVAYGESLAAGNTGGHVYVNVKDPSGDFFTPSAPPRLAVDLAGWGYSGNIIGSNIGIAVGDNRVIYPAVDAPGTTFGVVVSDVDPDPVAPTVTRQVRVTATAPAGSSLPAGGSKNLGVSARHAAWECTTAAGTNRVCLLEAGADGLFGTADDTTAVLTYPGTATQLQAFYFKLSGDRILIADPNNKPPGFTTSWFLIAVDAGVDHRFNTTDDVLVQVGPFNSTSVDFDLAGSQVVWVAPGSQGGLSVYLRNLNAPYPAIPSVNPADDGVEVSSHYSTKSGPVVEPSGRVFWNDAVLPTPTIFVYAP